MKFVLAVGFLVVFLFGARADDDVDNCKCWTNYMARKVGDNVQCHSVLSLARVPCNVPESPRCKCEEDVVTSIMTDKDGKWCQGHDKKWPCENAEEWNSYEQECKNELYCIPNSQKAV